MPAWAAHRPFTQKALARSVPAVGATIQPRRTVNLLLFLKAPDSKGSMMPPRVTYTEGGRSRVWNGGETLTTMVGPCPRNFPLPS